MIIYLLIVNVSTVELNCCTTCFFPFLCGLSSSSIFARPFKLLLTNSYHELSSAKLKLKVVCIQLLRANKSVIKKIYLYCKKHATVKFSFSAIIMQSAALKGSHGCVIGFPCVLSPPCVSMWAQCVYRHRIFLAFGKENSWSVMAWKTDRCQLLTHELGRGSERALEEPTPNLSRPCGSYISVDVSCPIPFDLAPCHCGAVTNYYTSLFIFTVLRRVFIMGELRLKAEAD